MFPFQSFAQSFLFILASWVCMSKSRFMPIFVLPFWLRGSSVSIFPQLRPPLDHCGPKMILRVIFPDETLCQFNHPYRCIFSLCRLGWASRALHTEPERMHAAVVYLSIWHPCSSPHTPPSPTHTSSLQSVTFLSREDTCMMRSHTRPWGQCLLCMSRFILELPGVQVRETREPGRGPAFVSG